MPDIPESTPEVDSPPAKLKRKSYKQAGLFAHLMLIVAVVAVFGSMLQSPVLWSEYDIVERSTYESMERWQDAWTLDAIRQENPLSVTSYFLEQSLPLETGVAHRLINLTLHLLASLLLLRLLQSLKFLGAFTAALVFALHPSLTQTLFMWGYRHELMGLIFILLALLFGTQHKHGFGYLLALLFTAIACIIHPSGIAIPVILGLILYLKNPTIHAKDFNPMLPILCVSILTCAWAASAPVAAANSTEFVSTTAEWSTHAGQTFFFYLGRVMGTGTPALFYPYDFSNLQTVSLEASLLPFVILLPFYAIALFQFRKRWSRGLMLGLTAFLALLLPALFSFGYNFDGLQAYEDHHCYVALPALLALLIVGSRHLVSKLEFAAKALWYAAVSLLLIVEVLISGSWSYALGQPTEMWTLQAEQWPDSWRPRVALLEEELNSDDSTSNASNLVQSLEEILKLNPELSDQRLLLARSYVKAGQKNNAIREYRVLIRDTQATTELINEAADLMDDLGMTRAARDTRKALETIPSGDSTIQNSN